MLIVRLVLFLGLFDLGSGIRNGSESLCTRLSPVANAVYGLGHHMSMDLDPETSISADKRALRNLEESFQPRV